MGGIRLDRDGTELCGDGVVAGRDDCEAVDSEVCHFCVGEGSDEGRVEKEKGLESTQWLIHSQG